MKAETILSIISVSSASKSPYMTPINVVKNLLIILFTSVMLYFAIAYFKDAPAFTRWALYIVGSYNILAALLEPLIRVSKVSGDSMLPTIKNNDYILNESFSKHLKIPYKRGDIVGFLTEDRNTNGLYQGLVKRIVGLPGDMISVKEGHFCINDELIDEPWNTKQKINYEIHQFANIGQVDLIGFALAISEPFEVPHNHYFVVGDNRKIADDAVNIDSSILGFIPKEHIFQKVLFVFYM